MRFLGQFQDRSAIDNGRKYLSLSHYAARSLKSAVYDVCSSPAHRNVKSRIKMFVMNQSLFLFFSSQLIQDNNKSVLL